MWNLLIVDPMTNALLYIYSLVGNFGLAIILFTLVVRIITHPLTVKQLKSSSAMQDLQKDPRFLEMQKKYKDDREKLGQETMNFYKEAGVNPFGSCLPTIVQFPVIIGLYQAIIAALASTPLQLVNFTRHVYAFFPNAGAIIPLNSKFLWMDLGEPERLNIFGFGLPLLAILVTITSFSQTKLMMPPSTGQNDQAQMMTRMMSIYMPLLMGWLSYTFPAGLALYFFVSNLFGILQYAALGKLNWNNLLPDFLLPKQKATAAISSGKSSTITSTPVKKTRKAKGKSK